MLKVGWQAHQQCELIDLFFHVRQVTLGRSKLTQHGGQGMAINQERKRLGVTGSRRAYSDPMIRDEAHDRQQCCVAQVRISHLCRKTFGLAQQCSGNWISACKIERAMNRQHRCKTQSVLRRLLCLPIHQAPELN